MLQLHGVMTAIVTPFADGKIDIDALRRVVRFQLENGVHGLVPLGSTGEAATIDFDERAVVIKTVLEEVDGKIPVVVGASTNNTANTIEMVRQAKELGADAAMIVTPYYNKPTPKGLLAHFDAIIEAVDIPLVAYNVPSRTGMNLTPDVAAELAGREALIGLKEASGNMMQVLDIARLTMDKWAIMSGEDLLFTSILAAGGKGIICTTSNVAPKRMVAIYDKWQAGDIDGARQAQLDMFPLIRAMFTQTNPIPVKAAASLMGLCGMEIRLPLLAMDGSDLESLKTILTTEGIL